MLLDTRERFELFIDKAETLRELSYIKFFENNDLSYTLQWRQASGLSNQAQLPETEALQAVATTLRFFTQPRDRISIILRKNGDIKDSMDELISDPDVSQEWKDHYQFVVGELRKKLVGPAIPIMQLNVNGQQLTAWDVFETIFYGDIAHANPDQRRTDRLWRNFGDSIYSMLRFALHNTIADMIKIISYVYRLCKDEIAGQPIPAFVLPTVPTVPATAESGDPPVITAQEPQLVETPTVIELTDQANWKLIPEASIISRIFGWTCTIIVFDNIDKKDTKGVLIVLMDTTGVSSPSDLYGRQYTSPLCQDIFSRGLS